MTWRPLAILAVIAVILGGCSADPTQPRLAVSTSDETGRTLA